MAPNAEIWYTFPDPIQRGIRAHHIVNYEHEWDTQDWADCENEWYSNASTQRDGDQVEWGELVETY